MRNSHTASLDQNEESDQDEVFDSVWLSVKPYTLNHEKDGGWLPTQPLSEKTDPGWWLNTTSLPGRDIGHIRYPNLV